MEEDGPGKCGIQLGASVPQGLVWFVYLIKVIKSKGFLSLNGIEDKQVHQA